KPDKNGLGAGVGEMVAAIPLANAAAVEGFAVGDIMASAIVTHPTIAAGSGSSAPEGFILGIVAPGTSSDGSRLNGDSAEQESADENDRL
ncbi:hypothetical protein BGZ80_008537, partial [Entomortierella chlamydospora]